MEISQGVRDRIFTAADAMYVESDRRTFPTVDAVRKRARVNMNDASAGMKEWRRAQTATAGPVVGQLPAELQGSCIAVLSGLWKEATSQANENLRTAQAGWEAERAESEELSRQLAAAYDAQTGELEAAQLEIARLHAKMTSMNTEVTAMKFALEAAERERVSVADSARETTVRALEIERRANDLQQTVEHVRQDVSRTRAEMEVLRATHAEQLERAHLKARQDLENERTNFERERERFHGDARAEMETTRVRHAEQLDRLRTEARQDLENERAKNALERAQHQEALTQALGEAARLKGRLETFEGHSNKEQGTRAKSKGNGAATGKGQDQ
jgi:colicin import membrane protein